MELLTTIANVFIYVSGILWSIELIPQIIKTVKRRSIKDISPIYFFISFTAYILYLIANTILENWPIVFSHIPGLCATIVMLCILYKYRNTI